VSDDAFSYVGQELEIFATARTWKGYWRSQITEFITSGRVLEVGAGIGANTALLCHAGVHHWVCLEPDASLTNRLRSVVQQQRLANCDVRDGGIGTLGATECFDAILYIDVLEHIADDRAELEKAFHHLAPGGALIILAPAHQWLFSPFDAAIGHFRRYNRRTLELAIPAALQRQFVKYLDSVGLLASTMNRYLLRQSHPTSRQIEFWDRRLVTASKIVDPLLMYSAGKSILGVWRRS
jgi:2-polyprenyl-3-methyl-5-hydroxy-6-metoxy-1,4-benzoquinol methylase